MLIDEQDDQATKERADAHSWVSNKGSIRKKNKKKNLSPLPALLPCLDPVETHRFSHLLRIQTDAANPVP